MAYNPTHRAHNRRRYGRSARGYTVVRTAVMTDELPQASPAGVVAPPGTLPPLENGDRHTRSDFEQRYDAIPQIAVNDQIMSWSCDTGGCSTPERATPRPQASTRPCAS